LSFIHFIPLHQAPADDEVPTTVRLSNAIQPAKSASVSECV
jgi:hypothetical protein